MFSFAGTLRLPPLVLVVSSTLLLLPGSAHADGTCQVPRNARPGDQVCVSRQEATTVQQENANAADNRQPDGAYGPATCKPSLVWREAYPGDTVCVVPARRQASREETELAVEEQGPSPTPSAPPPSSPAAPPPPPTNPQVTTTSVYQLPTVPPTTTTYTPPPTITTTVPPPPAQVCDPRVDICVR